MNSKNIVKKLTVVRIQLKDYKRLDKLKLHKTEPRWSVIERALDSLWQDKNLPKRD